jgi:hypothetical protein
MAIAAKDVTMMRAYDSKGLWIWWFEDNIPKNRQCSRCGLPPMWLERINAVVLGDGPLSEGCMLVLIFGVENVWVPRIFVGNWNPGRITSGEIVRLPKVQTDLDTTLFRNEKSSEWTWQQVMYSSWMSSSIRVQTAKIAVRGAERDSWKLFCLECSGKNTTLG